jgi:hypothetical protein
MVGVGQVNMINTGINQGLMLGYILNWKAPLSCSTLFAKKEPRDKMDNSLKMAYTNDMSSQNCLEVKVKFLGVDNDTVPAEWCSGPKEYGIDGDIHYYNETLKFTVVPEAFEMLINPNYFRRFKFINTGDKSTNEAKKYEMAIK